MVSGEYDSIGSKCCKIKSTRHDFHSPISWKPQSPSCHLRRRDFLFNFRFVLHDENAWTKRRKWAGGFNGEYEIAAERNRRDRWTDAVRDVICYVTPLKCQFLGPRMETKNCNHARRDMEEPRQLPRSLPRVRASDKNTLRHCRAAQKTQVWLPKNIAEHTRPDIWPSQLS